MAKVAQHMCIVSLVLPLFCSTVWGWRWYWWRGGGMDKTEEG
jgi:hypothetical protein